LSRALGLRIVAVAVLALFANCAPAFSGSVRVENAWLRWLPAGVPSAGYLTLINDGDTAVALIAAESADFREVTIHRSVEHAGTMTMEQVQEISIGPHSRVDFAAQGYHLMLMNPVRPIDTQAQVSITLRFRDGSSQPAHFQVRKGASQ
jgi:periplasmic copper chaperone A